MVANKVGKYHVVNTRGLALSPLSPKIVNSSPNPFQSAYRVNRSQSSYFSFDFKQVQDLREEKCDLDEVEDIKDESVLEPMVSENT